MPFVSVILSGEKAKRLAVMSMTGMSPALGRVAPVKKASAEKQTVVVKVSRNSFIRVISPLLAFSGRLNIWGSQELLHSVDPAEFASRQFDVIDRQ